MYMNSINTAIDTTAHVFANVYTNLKYPQGDKRVERTRRIVEFNIKNFFFNVSTVLLVAAAAKLFFLSLIPAVVFGTVGYVLREGMLSNLKQYEKEPGKTIGDHVKDAFDLFDSDEEGDLEVHPAKNILKNLGVKNQPEWVPDYYISDHVVWKKLLPINPASPRKGTDLIDEVGALFRKASKAVSNLVK